MILLNLGQIKSKPKTFKMKSKLQTFKLPQSTIPIKKLIKMGILTAGKGGIYRLVVPANIAEK